MESNFRPVCDLGTGPETCFNAKFCPTWQMLPIQWETTAAINPNAKYPQNHFSPCTKDPKRRLHMSLKNIGILHRKVLISFRHLHDTGRVMWLNHGATLGLLSSISGETVETRGIYVSCLVTGWWCRSAGSRSGCTALKGGIIYIPHTAERPFWSEERFLSVYVFAAMCFGAVFNIIFHIFFIAVGAFGHLYSQEDTENPSKLSLLHLNHFDCFVGGGYLLIVTMTFLQSKSDHWLCKLFYISPVFSLCYGLKRTPS